MHDKAKKLHTLLQSKGLYTKSFEDFQGQFNNPESIGKLHGLAEKEGIYTKGAEAFSSQFFPAPQEVTETPKKKDPSVVTSQTTEFPTSTGAELDAFTSDSVSTTSDLSGSTEVAPPVKSNPDVDKWMRRFEKPKLPEDIGTEKLFGEAPEGSLRAAIKDPSPKEVEEAKANLQPGDLVRQTKEEKIKLEIALRKEKADQPARDMDGQILPFATRGMSLAEEYKDIPFYLTNSGKVLSESESMGAGDIPAQTGAIDLDAPKGNLDQLINSFDLEDITPDQKAIYDATIVTIDAAGGDGFAEISSARKTSEREMKKAIFNNIANMSTSDFYEQAFEDIMNQYPGGAESFIDQMSTGKGVASTFWRGKQLLHADFGMARRDKGISKGQYVVGNGPNGMDMITLKAVSDYVNYQISTGQKSQEDFDGLIGSPRFKAQVAIDLGDRKKDEEKTEFSNIERMNFLTNAYRHQADLLRLRREEELTQNEDPENVDAINQKYGKYSILLENHAQAAQIGGFEGAMEEISETLKKQDEEESKRRASQTITDNEYNRYVNDEMSTGDEISYWVRSNLGEPLTKSAGNVAGGFMSLGRNLGLESGLVGENLPEVAEFSRKFSSTADKYLNGELFNTPTALQNVINEDGSTNWSAVFHKTMYAGADFAALMIPTTALAKSSKIANLVGKGNKSFNASLVAVSYVQNHNRNYQSAIDAGLTKEQAVDYSRSSTITQSFLELVAPNKLITGRLNPTDYLSRNVIKRMKNGATSKVANFETLKSYFKEIKGEITQEMMTGMAEAFQNKITNESLGIKAFDETFDADEAYETVLVTTLLTGVLGLRGFSKSSRTRTKNDLENVALFEAVKKFDITNKRIDTMVENETMSKEDAVMVKDHLKEAKTVLDGLPSEFTGDQKTQLVSLLIEKKKLKEQDSKSYKDEKFEATKTAEINAQIAEIDKIIDKVMVDKAAEVGDPVTDEQKGEPRLEITNVGEDVEYKVNDNFFSEKDLKENLASPEFIEKIKNGEVTLSVNNPSPAIQNIIEASGLVKTEQDVATQEEAQSEAGETTTPTTETKPTEATKEEVKPDSKVSEDAPPAEKPAPVAKKEEVVPKAEREEFIDKGTVTEERISSIADKVKNNEELSQTETEIFTDKTTEVNEKITETTPKAEAKVTETVESLGETSAAPMANPKVFEAVTSLAKEIAVEKGLKGAKLKTALSEKVEELSGGKISKADVAEAFSEINQSVPKTAKAIKEAKTEKVKVSKGRAMAEKVRDKKFEDAFSSMGTLSINVPGLFKQAINTSLEAAAITLEATAKVSEAVSSGIKNLKGTEWYKGLSSESKTKAEKEFKKIFEAQSAELETAQPKEARTETEKAAPKKQGKKDDGSKIAKRRATGGNITKSEAAKLLKMSSVKTIVQKEVVDEAEALIEKFGTEEAIEFVNDESNASPPAAIEAVKMTAAAIMEKESASHPVDSIERAKLKTRSLELIAEVSSGRKRQGQAAAIIHEIIKRNPNLERKNDIQTMLSEEKSSALDVIVDGKRVAKEIVEEIRKSVTEEVTKALREEMKGLRKGSPRLNKKMNDVQERLDGKKKTDKQKIEKLNKEVDDLWVSLKRKNPNKGPSGGLILLSSLDPHKVTIVAEIIKKKIQIGGLTTRQIVKDVIKKLSTIGVNATNKEIEDIGKNVPEYVAAKEKESKVTEGDTEAQIQDKAKQALKKEGTSISDVVSKHYTSKTSLSKNLAKSLMDEAGLTKAEATSLAAKIESAIESLVRKTSEIDLARMLRPNEGISKESKKQRKENSKITTKIIKAVNLGALNTELFSDAFADKFGFRAMSLEQRAEIIDLVDQIEAHEIGIDPETGLNLTERELKRKAVLRLNNIISDLKPRNAAFWGELLMEVSYTHVLSGMNTQKNANVGAMLTSIINVAATMVSSPVTATGMGIMNSFSPTTLRASSARAREARKKNFSMYDSMNTYSEGIPSDRQGAYERSMMIGVKKYAERLKNDPDLANKSKAFIGVIYSALVQPIRLTHLLKASDAFLTSQYSEFMNTIDEYNIESEKLGMTGVSHPFGSKKLINNVNKKMAWDKIAEFERIADQEIEAKTREIENKIDAKIKKGEIKPGARKRAIRKEKERTISRGPVSRYNQGYRSRRIKELQENQRNQETLTRSIKTVREWIMLSQPDGVIGSAVSWMQRGQKIKETDSSLRVAGKVALGVTIMFPRMTGNFFNAIKTGTPIFGAIDAVFGYSKDVNGDTVWNKWKADKALATRRLTINAMTSVLTYFLYHHMFTWDEEEEIYVPNPDRLIDISSVGFGSFAKNEKAEHGFSNFSIRGRWSADEEFSKPYTLKYAPQLLGLAAYTGRAMDDAKGIGKEEDIEARKNSTFSFYASGLVTTPLESFLEGSFVSVGKSVKSVTYADNKVDGFATMAFDLAAQPFKNVLQPNITRDIINEVQAFQGVNRKEKPDNLLDKMLYDFYGMDFYQKEKTDLFGNPYPKQFKFSQWVEGYRDTYDSNPEVRLMYKFETGVGTGRFKADKQYNFQGITMNLNEDQRAEMETIHQREYKQGVLDELDELDDLEEKVDLERDLARIKKIATRTAKEEMLEKYFLDSE